MSNASPHAPNLTAAGELKHQASRETVWGNEDVRGTHIEAQFYKTNRAGVVAEDRYHIPPDHTIRFVGADAPAVRALQASLRRHPNQAVKILSIAKEAEATRAVVVERLTPNLAHIPHSVFGIVLHAMIIGQQKTSPGRLACFCKLNERTLRNRLKRARLPKPNILLGLAIAVRIAHVCDVYGWSLTAVATRAGFATTDELRTYVKTRTGNSPSFWKHAGYEEALAIIHDHLAVDHDMIDRELFVMPALTQL